MTQQRTFPENVRRATPRRPSQAGLYVPARPKAEDLPLILEWAAEIRTEDAIAAYARTKVPA